MYSLLKKKHKKLINKFFKLVNTIIYKHPLFVVVILHEYTRVLYNYDPFIKTKIKDPEERFIRTTNNLIKLIKCFSGFGHYNLKNSISFFKNLKKNKMNTEQIYAPLWKKFSKKNNDDAYKILKLRFKKNIFKNKKVLDAGCGGGRYANAIKKFGAKKVIGVDLGYDGLKLAKKNFKNIKGLIFKKASILKLPYKANTFDVVFSNGVIHHSKNIIKGVREAVRVCKKNGKIFLYLYATGGVFWYSRMIMNKLMKKIPYSYSESVLNLIKMPSNRFIFMDNWYVPIEKHSSHQYIFKILKKLNVRKIEKIYSKNKLDFEYALKIHKNGKYIWGEGDIRLLVTK